MNTFYESDDASVICDRQWLYFKPLWIVSVFRISVNCL